MHFILFTVLSLHDMEKIRAPNKFSRQELMRPGEVIKIQVQEDIVKRHGFGVDQTSKSEPESKRRYEEEFVV